MELKFNTIRSKTLLQSRFYEQVYAQRKKLKFFFDNNNLNSPTSIIITKCDSTKEKIYNNDKIIKYINLKYTLLQ